MLGLGLSITKDNTISEPLTLQEALSAGSYKLLQKPFQYEALGFTFRYDDITNTTSNLTWDLTDFTASNYTNFIAAVQPLDDYPSGAGDIAWSKLVEDDGEGNYPLTTLEQTKFNNIVRIQFEDDNVNPLNPTIIEEARLWFLDKRADSNYDDKILSIDPAFVGYSNPTEVAYMLDVIDADLIMFNDYPWGYHPTLHFRQLEYGFYSRNIYWHDQTILGNDGGGNKPVPFGTFTQAVYNGKAEKMPHTYMKYNNFLPLLFGAKYLSTYLYQSWFTWLKYAPYVEPGTPDMISGQESILHDVEFPFAPTAEWTVQNEIIRQVKNIGDSLLRLNPTGQRFIRATNIQAPVQSAEFAAGVYDWDYGTRPDTRLTDVTVTRTGFADTQDVWVGYFNPVHSSFAGGTSEVYFMVVSGCWDDNEARTTTNTIKTTNTAVTTTTTNTPTEQIIRLDFDFGADATINSLLKKSRDTGLVEVVPLTLISGNTYYYNYTVNGGEGDLFKYDNGVTFI